MDGAATAWYDTGRGTFDLGIYIYTPVQARILFETFFGGRGVESLPRSCAKEFRHLDWAPLFYHNLVSQVAAAASVRAGIPHPFKCAAAAVQVLSHTRFYHTPKYTLWVFGRATTPLFIIPPHLSRPQTHLVGVRTSYHTPWFITPPGLSHPLGPPAS